MNAFIEQRIWRPEDSDSDFGVGIGRLVDELALDYFSYVMLAPPRGSSIDNGLLGAANYPQEFVDLYLRQHFVLVDPVIDLAKRLHRPFLWGPDHFPRALGKRQQRVQDAAHAFRVVHGLAIPVRCADGSVSVFNVVASDEKRLVDSMRCESGRLFAAAYDVHDFMLDRGLAAQNALCGTDVKIARTNDGVREHEVATREDDGGPCLAVREKEILLWTLDGRTAEEVAAILSLSVFTVNRHAFNATRKLGCRNKYHAAVRALRANLI